MSAFDPKRTYLVVCKVAILLGREREIAFKSFRFGAVYCAPPIFNADIDEMGYFEPSELGISAALLADIGDWNRAFQSTYCDAYPP